MTALRVIAIAPTALLCFGPAAFGAELPNVKLGLWEMTWSVQTSGEVPMPDMSKLPLAQRAIAEAAMKAAMANMNAPHSFKTCLGEDQLKKGSSFDFEKDKSCTTTVLKSTANELHVQQVCTGKRPRTVSIDYKAKTPESVSGVSHVELNLGNKPITADGKMTGAWLGEDCGKLKPGQVAKK
jgi:hypothetical protein